ncbi:transketolase 2, thiamin-binding [Candidatus Zixiibacteriota bacterium]|nr:transketolase 2, thiamin-binding [candidate division Zixibacteria bacterium]
MNDQDLLDNLCINSLRFLAVDAVQKANSGHPGMPMGAAPMAYVLWTKFLKHNPADPGWFDRDRFVLSAGHGSMLLYALLHVTGYDLPLDEIKKFRQWGSIAPGHPERLHTPGVEVTTGPLGQGFANGVGMAIAEKHLAARFNRSGHQIIDHFTYGICGDGDIMEGISSEAASLAGHLELGKLIYLYDANHISLAASTDLTLTEDVRKRFEAYHWHTQTVDDGNNLQAIGEAITAAREETRKPSLIIVRTHIGYGSPNRQDTFAAHGQPLGEDEVIKTKKNLGWPEDRQFYIPEEALRHFREALANGADAEKDWKNRFNIYARQFPDAAAELNDMIKGELPDGWTGAIPKFVPEDGKISTRVASGKIINALAPKIPALIGGAADLAPSTMTAMKDYGDFEPPDKTGADTQGSFGGGWNWTGRNLHFGVREHAMGAIANGLAAHGAMLPFVSTFLIFSDYMRPTIRLASLMKLPVKYIFTHDSIAVGEDGPTHQPVEHLASLRAIPGLIVIRPADAAETAIAWQIAMEETRRPVALILSRQNLPILDRKELAPAESAKRGAYILYDAENSEPDIIMIATGSEVALTLGAAKILHDEGIGVRVVSMPSWELFGAQDDAYRKAVLPDTIRTRLAVEAASPLGWERWVGIDGDVIGVDKFGASAPDPRVLQAYGFSIENICERARKLIKRREVVQ